MTLTAEASPIGRPSDHENFETVRGWLDELNQMLAGKTFGVDRHLLPPIRLSDREMIKKALALAASSIAEEREKARRRHGPMKAPQNGGL